MLWNYQKSRELSIYVFKYLNVLEEKIIFFEIFIEQINIREIITFFFLGLSLCRPVNGQKNGDEMCGNRHCQPCGYPGS